MDHNTQTLTSIIRDYRTITEDAQNERVRLEDERQAEIKKNTAEIVESLGFKPPFVITAKEDDGAGYWFLIHEGQELTFRLWKVKHEGVGVQLSKWKCPDCGDYIFTRAAYSYGNDQAHFSIASLILEGVPDNDHECPNATYGSAPAPEPKEQTPEEKLGAAIRDYVEGKILEYHSQQHEGR